MSSQSDYFAQPVLRGHGLRLEPLDFSHEAGLKAAAADGELWTLRVTSVPEPENTRSYIEAAQRMHAEKKRVPYAVIAEASGKVLGSTSFHDLIPEAGRLEIGYTWYAKSVQRSSVNTACKLVMMSRGFDELSANLVGWRTDIFNFASQRAIERLGAKREAVLRSHALRRDGTVRDSVIYGMPKADWPAARERLLARLQVAPSARPQGELRFVDLGDLNFDQLSALAKLDPGALGSRFVAANGVSIAQAAAKRCAVLRAILRGADPVGLILLYDCTLDPAEAQADGHALDEVWIWRLMVGFAHHGQGIGETALKWAHAYAQSRLGVSTLKLCHVPHENGPESFYKRFGFAHTGEEDDGELVMAKAV